MIIENTIKSTIKPGIDSPRPKAEPVSQVPKNMSITSTIFLAPCYGIDCPIKTHCQRGVLGGFMEIGKENFKYNSTLDEDGQEIGCFNFVEIRGRE